MTQHKPISISIEDLPNLKRQYTKAIKTNKTKLRCWLVCGQQGTFIVSYAKYLIERLIKIKDEQTKLQKKGTAV